MSKLAPVRRVTGWIRARVGVLARFGAVGVLGIFVNLGVFNALRLGPLGPDQTVGGNDDRVVTAKVIATLVSVAFAWIAHRGWTFKGRRRHQPLKELVLFGAVNAVAVLLEAGTVALTHHGLGLTSLLADNIFSLVGIGLGTIARYAGFTTLVFSPAPSPADASAGAATGSPDAG